MSRPGFYQEQNRINRCCRRMYSAIPDYQKVSFNYCEIVNATSRRFRMTNYNEATIFGLPDAVAVIVSAAPKGFLPFWFSGAVSFN